MEIELDLLAAVPAYEQLRMQIAGHIRLGNLRPGDKLPSVRQLANDLGIAPGTAAKAYSLLEQGHLVELSHGRAARVKSPQQPNDEVMQALKNLVAASKRNSIDLGVTLETITTLWKQ